MLSSCCYTVQWRALISFTRAGKPTAFLVFYKRSGSCCPARYRYLIDTFGGATAGEGTTKIMAATFLPAPRHNYQVHVDEAAPSSLLASTPKKSVPPYGQRQSFVPRAQADFGDGGAFPEIHVAQFPLEMGRPASSKKSASSVGGSGGGGGVGGISGLGNNAGSTAIVAVDVDDTGKVRASHKGYSNSSFAGWQHLLSVLLPGCVSCCTRTRTSVLQSRSFSNILLSFYTFSTNDTSAT